MLGTTYKVGVGGGNLGERLDLERASIKPKQVLWLG
jgi:hypothetical protein